MRIRRVVICLLFLLAPTILSESRQLRAADGEKHLLYVAVPGIRNYVEYGGVGILVYDIGAGHKFVKRIPTWNMPPGQAPENVKGIAASARTGKLYVSTTKRLLPPQRGDLRVADVLAPTGRAREVGQRVHPADAESVDGDECADRQRDYRHQRGDRHGDSERDFRGRA